jgi:hypothetical protein
MGVSRRTILRAGAVLAATAGLSSLARADSLPMLSESDPLAQALGYRADATKVDKSKFAQYAAGQACASCSLYGGAAGATSGPCPLYAGKAVSASGWCASYAKKG